MSVISDLSQHKKNVVIDLFGNSKDIYHRMKTINTQIVFIKENISIVINTSSK